MPSNDLLVPYMYSKFYNLLTMPKEVRILHVLDVKTIITDLILVRYHW